jgi:hypothetical protein
MSIIIIIKGKNNINNLLEWGVFLLESGVFCWNLLEWVFTEKKYLLEWAFADSNKRKIRKIICVNELNKTVGNVGMVISTRKK